MGTWPTIQACALVDWESNWWPFGSQPGAQTTEPHQPGLKQIIFIKRKFLHNRLKCFLILTQEYIFIDERNISVRETQMWERNISCLPNAPWPGIEPTTFLVYKMLLQPSQKLKFELFLIFAVLYSHIVHIYFLYLIPILTIRTSIMHFCYFESFYFSSSASHL